MLSTAPKGGLVAAAPVGATRRAQPGSVWTDDRSGAVGDDLGQAVAEVRGVEPPPEHGVAAELPGVVDQPLQGRVPGPIDHLGELLDLAALERPAGAGQALAQPDAPPDQA